MRQNHVAGDKLFVDYAGDKVPVVVDRLTGERQPAHLFVAVLGGSSLSYAEARWSETLPIGSPAMCMPSRRSVARRRCLFRRDAKVAVIKACLYDPQVNRSYAEMAAYYKQFSAADPAAAAA